METGAAAVASSPAEGARGAQGGLQGRTGPGLPASLTAAVMASLKESGETCSQEGHLPGDSKGSKEAPAAASVLIQAGKGPGGIADLKTAEAGAGGRIPPGDDWSTVVKGKAKRHSSGDKAEHIDSDKDDGRGIGRLARKLREGEATEPRKSNDIREGDWECKDQRCRWRNFSWRKQCMKCQKNPQGQEALGEQGASRGAPVTESALERARRIGERGETSRKHPKVLVLTINLLIENKTNMKPQLDDHYSIMKQAGLSLAEVKGKVGKNGYLEVALQPGAASAAGALWEVSKIVNDKITILSVREQGSSREVLLRWQEVPFGIPDETLLIHGAVFKASATRKKPLVGSL